MALSVMSGLAVVALPASARADAYVLERPGAHPRYDLELEGHVVAGTFGGPNPDDTNGFGLGLRATYEIVDNGFVETINNTFGISAGVDYMNWGTADVQTDRCTAGAGGELTCEVVEQTFYELVVPVTAQWNFWITRDLWSVFGEPGVALRFRAHRSTKFEPLVFFAGGRMHLTDHVALTLRVGYPYVSFGASGLF